MVRKSAVVAREETGKQTDAQGVEGVHTPYDLKAVVRQKIDKLKRLVSSEDHFGPAAFADCAHQREAGRVTSARPARAMAAP
jgi:hypothetical protein